MGCCPVYVHILPLSLWHCSETSDSSLHRYSWLSLNHLWYLTFLFNNEAEYIRQLVISSFLLSKAMSSAQRRRQNVASSNGRHLTCHVDQIGSSMIHPTRWWCCNNNNNDNNNDSDNNEVIKLSKQGLPPSFWTKKVADARKRRIFDASKLYLPPLRDKAMFILSLEFEGKGELSKDRYSGN